MRGSIRRIMDGRWRGELDALAWLVLSMPEDGNLLAMPAAEDELAITKLVTVHPGNAQRELPTIQGEAIEMEARTGTRLGILDAPNSAKNSATPGCSGDWRNDSGD